MHGSLPIIFASAYKQLIPVERQFVDLVVTELENAAHRAGERIIVALHKPIPDQLVERANGLLERALVRAAISERVSQIAADQDLTVQRWVREVSAVAFSNMGNYMHIDDEGVPVFDMTRCAPEHMAAVKSIECEETGDGFTRPIKRKMKVVLHDKIAGMNMLGKYMGALSDDNPHWRSEMAKAQPTIPEGASIEEAGDAYAEYLG